MKAKFIGDPRNPQEPWPESHSAHGVEFPRNKFVEVPDEVAAKFAGNDHYETQGAVPVVEADAPPKPPEPTKPAGRVKRPEPEDEPASDEPAE